MQALVLSLSISFLLALLYQGKTGYEPLHEFPKTIGSAIVFYGAYAAWEEIRFRVAPWIVTMLARQFFEEKRFSQIASLLIGFCMSVVFGVLHAEHYPTNTVWVIIALLDPVFSGLLYWYITEKDGIAASTLIHTCSNLVAWSFATGYFVS
jgi:hypothetical protein